MARRRDVVIGIIIAAAFLVAFGFFGLMIIGLATSDGDLGVSALGGEDVGLLEVHGEIDIDGGRLFIKQINRWTESRSIKAIVIDVNSPGGGVAASQEMYNAIIRAKKEKPVVVSMASVAASGGYYISCAADKVMANPGTITGSIGVIFQFHTVGELMDKVGIRTETIKSGELKDVGTYSRPMTKKEEAMLKAVVMDTYEQFVEVVAAGRGKERSEVYPLADGSVFTGLQAYNLGLVDTLGGLEDAVKLAGQMAGIKGEPNVVRPSRREKASIFDLLGKFLGNVNTSMEKGLSGPRLLYLYQ